MKIIFLDIDGVINSGRSFTAFQNQLKGTQAGWTMDEYFVYHTRTLLDPTSLALVNLLIKESGAKVVLSSSHRKLFRNNEAGIPEYLHDLGIEADVIGYTGDRDDGHRGTEIKEWIQAHMELVRMGTAENITAYLILDDDGDMLPEQQDNFVQTSNEDGFLLSHFIRAASILGCDSKYKHAFARLGDEIEAEIEAEIESTVK